MLLAHHALYSHTCSLASSMAPVATDTSSEPLGLWFWIAGVDSEQLTWPSPDPDEDQSTNGAPPSPVASTIEEDQVAEAEDATIIASPLSTKGEKRSSYNWPSRKSNEARLSNQSFSTLEKKGTDSNRSSATIKGVHLNGSGTGLSDLDFEKALRKFASERDSFLSDLTLSAGAVVPNRPKPRPKTQKIVNEDAAGLKSGVGSIRRRISFRDMNSMKRQPSVARQCGYLYVAHENQSKISRRHGLQYSC